MAKLIQHKLMISEFMESFDLVFGSSSSAATTTSSGSHHNGKKSSSSSNKSRKLVELVFETYGDKDAVQVKFEKLKEGKTEKRYKLIINYPMDRVGEFKFVVSKYCIEKKQVIISIEDFKLEKSLSLFVGKVDNKVFMMRLKDEYVGMPIAKVADKFFAPNCIDKSVSSEGCIMLNPNVFFVDEPSLMIKSTCDTAMGMFIPNGNYSEIEPVLHQLYLAYREYHQIWVKGFSFMHGFTPFPPVLNNLQNRDTYGEQSFGFCYKNGIYKIGETRKERYEFEECVELSMGHLKGAQKFQKGNFLDFVYVRGKVKKGAKGICTLSNWKRLCMSDNPNWLSQVNVI